MKSPARLPTIFAACRYVLYSSSYPIINENKYINPYTNNLNLNTFFILLIDPQYELISNCHAFETCVGYHINLIGDFYNP